MIVTSRGSRRTERVQFKMPIEEVCMALSLPNDHDAALLKLCAGRARRRPGPPFIGGSGDLRSTDGSKAITSPEATILHTGRENCVP